MHTLRALAFLMLGLSLCACTSAQTWSDGDPFEPFNRKMFWINQKLDHNAALPAAVFYRSTVPGGIRDSVHNLLSNTGIPITFANDILQAQFSRAGTAAERFCVNTTVGLLGVTDPATGMGLPMQQEDFGQTLGVYGVPAGPYVVLPLLGASLPRDAVGRIFVDHYFSPLSYIDYTGRYYVSLGARVFSTVDGRARAIEQIRDIERNSVDQYTGMRDAYIRHRQEQVDNKTPQDAGAAPLAN